MAVTGDDSATSTEPKAADDKVKAAAEGLKKLLDLVVPEPTVEKSASSTTASVVDEMYGAISATEITDFATSARDAAERYRNAMRWLVGAIAAIGVLLFGSTAFVEGDPLSIWPGGAGLLLASIGLVLILTAATLVFEPEDASLGELAMDIDRARAKLTSDFRSGPPPKYRVKRVRAFFRTRLRSTLRFSEIVEGPEAEAHLGAGHHTVRCLIESIGRGQNTDRANRAKHLAMQRRRVAATISKRELVVASLGKLLDTRSALDKTKNDYGFTLEPTIRALIVRSEDLRAEADNDLDQLIEKQDLLEKSDHQLGMDLLHRSLVLTESAVAQLRGTFRLSRTYLLLGAILTLVGALFYIAGVKDAGEDSSGKSSSVVRSGTLVVAPGTPAADEFRTKCLKPTVLAVNYFSESAPKLADDFEIVVSAPEDCADDYSIPGGRGDGDAILDLGPPVSIPAKD